MTREEQEQLIERGREINVQLVPIEVGGELGVGYLGFKSANYWVVSRDLTIMESRMPEKPE